MSEVKAGKYYSWEILSLNVAVKECDKTFFEAGETGIPREIYAFFDCESFAKGDERSVVLRYKGTEEKATLRMKNDDVGRVHLSWRRSLQNRLKKDFPKIRKASLYIRFEKVNSFLYDVSFVNVEMVDEDLKDASEDESWNGLTEGKKIIQESIRYERSSELRRKAILIHGCKCEVCGFDFEEKYGQLGANFIEVHHIIPLSATGEEREANPYTDLVCLCSNCHSMIHRKKEHTFSVEELKECVAQTRNVR